MAGQRNEGVLAVAVPCALSYGAYNLLKSSGAYPELLYLTGGMAALCAVIAAKRSVDSLAYWFDMARLRKAAGTYGTTEKLNSRTPKQIGLKTSNEDGNGIPLGAKHGSRKREIMYYDGDSHCMFLNPTGGGKSNSFGKPARLALGAERNAIITSKGVDMAVSTNRFLTEELGQTVVNIDPYRQLKEHGIKSDNFNPTGNLVELAEKHSPDLIEKAREIAQVILPDPAGGSGDNKIFRAVGRQFITWSLVYLALEEADTGHLCCNLAYLYRMLNDGPEVLLRFFQEMTLCTDFDGVVSMAGKRFAGKFKNAPKSAESFLTEAQEALAIFDPVSMIGKSIEYSTFNAADLKTPGKKITIHIVLPVEKSESNNVFIALCLNTLISQCIEAGTFEPRVTIIADEFENISTAPIPIMERLLKTGRTLGVQLMAFVQDLKGLEARYKELTSMFITQSAILMAWDVRSVEDAELFSKRAGQRSIVTDSYSVPDAGGNPSISIREEGIPVLRVDQFTQMPKFQAVLFKEQHPPMIVDLVHFKEVDPWVHQIDHVAGALPEPDFRVRYKA